MLSPTTAALPVTAATESSGAMSYNQMALQRYILHCCQNVDGGGLRDKPGKSRDFYHSCYSLSGLSIAQRFGIRAAANSCRSSSSSSSNSAASENSSSSSSSSPSSFALPSAVPPTVYGDTDNLLEPTSIVFNIGVQKLKNALDFYKPLPSSHAALIAAFQDAAAPATER